MANSAWGLRGDQLTSRGRWRAMTALLLLGPGTPLLFQGQEFSASAPFLYFADFDEELNAAVREGRRKFLSQFPSVSNAARRGLLDDPAAVVTFERCRLDLRERESNAQTYALHRDLLRLRDDRSIQLRGDERGVDGAVLSSSAFALRFFMPRRADDRVLVVNLGADLRRRSIRRAAAGAARTGATGRSSGRSEDPSYGGGGIAAGPAGRRALVRSRARARSLLAPQPRTLGPGPACHGART